MPGSRMRQHVHSSVQPPRSVIPRSACRLLFSSACAFPGHLRSHTEERPFVCEWPGCGKGFARQHDCKCVALSRDALVRLLTYRLQCRRHQALHAARSQATNVCQGCGKTFSRLDALNVSSFVRPPFLHVADSFACGVLHVPDHLYSVIVSRPSRYRNQCTMLIGSLHSAL